MQQILLTRRLVSSATYTLFIIILPLYSQTVLNFSLHKIAYFFAILYLFNYIFSLFSGILGDRSGHIKVMIFGMILDTLGYTMFILFSNKIICYYFSAILIGIGGTAFSSNARYVLSKVVSNKKLKKAKMLSSYQRITNLGAIIGVFVSFFPIHFNTFRLFLWVIFIFEMVILVNFLLFMYKKKIIEDDIKEASFYVSLQKSKEIILSKEFIILHLLGGIPYLFMVSNSIIIYWMLNIKLHFPQLITPAFLLNVILLVILQHKATLTLIRVKQINIVLVLANCIFFISLNLFMIIPSIITGFLFIFITTMQELVVLVIISNYLSSLDTKDKCGGFIFSLSKFFLGLISILLLSRIETILNFIYSYRYENIIIFSIVSILFLIIFKVKYGNKQRI